MRHRRRQALEQLTTAKIDVIKSNMKATLVLRERIELDEESFVELVVWKLPRTLPGSAHDFKYHLALVSNDVCVMRYDNEAEKGDHRHLGDVETDYVFENLQQLESDFWNDVEQWRKS
jgi:Family of unknown function (DUF6516)